MRNEGPPGAALSGRRNDDPLGMPVAFACRAYPAAALKKRVYNAPFVRIQGFGLDRFTGPPGFVGELFGHHDNALFSLLPEIIDIEEQF